MSSFLPQLPNRFAYFERNGAYESPEAMKRVRTSYRRIYAREYARQRRKERTTLYPSFDKAEMKVINRAARKHKCSPSHLVRQIVLQHFHL